MTNATWQDLWLNEGWTTYAETRITELLEGKEFNDLNVGLPRTRDDASHANRLGMELPADLPETGAQTWRSRTFRIPYYKGCFFLQECERAVGRPRFDQFIKKYMKRFQFQSITTETFLDFMKAELPEVFAKVDVQRWIYEPGMPDELARDRNRIYMMRCSRR